MAYSPLRPQGDTFDSKDAIRQNIAADQDVMRAVMSTAQGISAGDLASSALAQERAGDPNWEATRDAYLRSAEQQAELAPRVSSLRQVGGLGDAVDFAQQAFAGGVTSSLPSLAAGLVTRGRSPLSAYAGAALPSYMMSRGEIAANQYSDPVLAASSVEERDKAATYGGGVNALLESIVPGSLANAAFRRPTKSFAAEVGREALTEGVTEGLQTGVEHLANKYVDPNQQLDPWNVADAVVQGALGGGGMAAATLGPSHLAGSIMDRKAQRDAAAAAAGLPPDTSGNTDALGLPPPDAPPPSGLENGFEPDPNIKMLEGNEFAAQVEEIDSTPAKGVVEDVIDKLRGAAGYVNAKIDKAKEAYAKSGSAMDFVNSVFGGIGEDISNLAKGPEDASLAGATPEETIQNINLNDAAKLQSAKKVAEALLQDEDIPSLFRDRIANLNGDYSSPVSQNYIHALANGKRVAVQMSSALAGLSKMAGKAKNKLEEALASGSKRQNLQEFDEATIQPLVAELAKRLGPVEAAKAPELARQMMAVSARLSDATDMQGADEHLKLLSNVVDDKLLDQITELSGSDALRKAITRTREIPNASNDVRKSGGNSFLESVLVDKSITPYQREQIAELVDAKAVGYTNLNDLRQTRIAEVLAPAFGSVQTAKTVLDYYGKLQRTSAELSKVVTPDDRPMSTTHENPDVVPSHEKLVELGDMTEQDGQEFRYGFRQASSELPFRKFGKTNPAGQSEGQIARDRMKGVSANSRTHLVPYSDYLAEKGMDPKAGVAFMGASIKRRIEDHKKKMNLAKTRGDKEDAANRKRNIEELRGELMMLNEMAKQAGDKRALDGLYEVLRHGESSAEDKVDAATDADIKPMQVSADKYPESVLTFRRGDGSTLKLSAISMIKHQGNKRKNSGKVLSPLHDSPEQMLFSAISSVLARGDLELETKLDEKVQIRAVEKGVEGRTLKATKAENLPKEEEGGFTRNEMRLDAEAAYAEDNDVEEPTEEQKLTGDTRQMGYKDFIAEIEDQFEVALGGTPAGSEEIIARDAQDILEEMEARRDEAFKRRDKAKVTMRSLMNEAKKTYAKSGTEPWLRYYLAAGKYDFESKRAFAFHDAVKGMTYLLETHNREEARDEADLPELEGFAANKRKQEEDTPIWRGDQDKNAELKLQPLIKTDAILEANPELLTVYDSMGMPRDATWSMNKVRERLVTAYQGIGTVALKRRLEEIQKRLAGELPQATANTYRLLEQVIGNIITKRDESGADKKAEIKEANKAKKEAAKAPAAPLTGLARMEKLVADDKAVKRDGVYYLTDAAASKRVSGVTSDGHVYVNLAKLKEGGLLAALKDSPTKTAALANPKLDVLPEQLVEVLGNVRRQASFLRDYEIGRAKALKGTDGRQSDRYPRKPDGTPNTTAPRAIDIESSLILDALTPTEITALSSGTILRRLTSEPSSANEDERYVKAVDEATAQFRNDKEEVVRTRAEAEKQSAQNTRGGKPNNNTKKQDAIKAELLKMLGAKISVAFKKFAAGAGSGTYSWDPKLKQHVIEIATNAGDMHGVAMHEALHAFFRALGKDANLRTVRRDLMATANSPYAMKKLRELLAKHPAALKQIEDDMEERVAYMFQFWEAGLMPELGQTGTSLFQRLLTMIRELVGLASQDERAVELMTKFREGAFSDMSIAAEVIKDVNAKTLTTKLEAMAPSVVAAGRKLYQAGPDRLRAYSVPVLNALADQFSSETGSLGFIQRRLKRNGEWQNRLALILKDTSAVERRKALDNLQSMLPPTSKLEKALAKYFEDMYDYMDKAGVKRFDPKAKDWVPVNKLGRYFPRAWDSNTIRANRAAWERLLAKNNVSQDQIKKVTDAIIKGDGHIDLAESVGHMGFTPFAAGVQNRQFTFINQSNAAEFAKFQTKELADVVVKYTKQAVHRAEYARMFGNSGENISKAIKAAKLNQKEQAEVLTVVRGLEGTLDGNGISQDTKSVMSWIMTAQNVVLLPLAIFSQMIDPVAIAARSGDLGDAGSAYVTAIKRLFDKNPSHAEKMARMMGIISSDSTLEAMGMSYGSSYMSPGAQAVNRMFFKYNGMQHWNDSMRIAATAAGESYLIDNLKNDAVLKELGLEKGDILHKNGRILLTAEQFAARHGGAVTTADEERATRVQEAMFRFVDSAVLRPSASQRPTWMSDPRFMLVGHLKQFTFATHNVILKRAQRELDYNDNVRPSATLMLSVPIILAADLVKMAFTGAPPGWGYTDYIKHAVQRSGILGLRDFGTVIENDVARGKAPGEGLLGPAAEHLLKILRWVFNDPKTSFEDVVDRTIPGARFV